MYHVNYDCIDHTLTIYDIYEYSNSNSVCYVCVGVSMKYEIHESNISNVRVQSISILVYNGR